MTTTTAATPTPVSETTDSSISIIKPDSAPGDTSQEKPAIGAGDDTGASEPELVIPDLFEPSPVGQNPLGEGKYIKSAAALVIGDEILNGKTQDTNSHAFAKFCFELGIDLKRIEVIPDEEEEIVEASRRLVNAYDFVITTGGIGPTHDDITYQSLAKAFSLPLKHHEETLRRMAVLSRGRYDFSKQTPEQKTARERMALFPHGDGVEIIYTARDLWVPVVRLQGKLCIFPGIPSLFKKMLIGITPHLPLPPQDQRPFRYQVFTKLAESNIAPFLTSLQERVKAEGVRIGSYPLLLRGVFVSLIGPNEARVREIGDEVVKELQGTVVKDEGDVKL